jgi:hypothetical protein
VTDAKDWVVAFAGPGDTTEENVKVLLDRWLPSGVAEVIVPERVPRACKGLKTTVAWLSDEFGEGALTKTKDIVAELKEAAADDEVETYLVLLWGDEGDEDSEKLLSAATDLGIPVKDLTAGLDDVQFEDSPPADPEPEAPKRERKTRGRSKEPDAPSAEAASGTHKRHPATKAQEEANGDAPKTRGKPRQPATIVAEGVTPNEPPWEEDGTRSPVRVVPIPQTEDIEKLIDERLAKALHDFADTIVPKTPGRPRADGTPAQPRGEKKTAYLLKDGEYTKRGRGRPTDDEEAETVWLTDEEIAALPS